MSMLDERMLEGNVWFAAHVRAVPYETLAKACSTLQGADGQVDAVELLAYCVAAGAEQQQQQQQPRSRQHRFLRAATLSLLALLATSLLAFVGNGGISPWTTTPPHRSLQATCTAPCILPTDCAGEGEGEQEQEGESVTGVPEDEAGAEGEHEVEGDEGESTSTSTLSDVTPSEGEADPPVEIDFDDPASMLPLNILLVMLIGIPCLIGAGCAYYFCFKRP